MSQSDNAQKYEYLSAMTTEQLRELLRLEIESDQDHDELVLHILEVINRRKKDEDHQQITWQQARADFDKYYNTPDGKGRQLYPMGADRKEKPAKRKHGTVIRWVATVAAVLAIVLLTVPPALGYSDVWDMVVRWTDEVIRVQYTAAEKTPVPEVVENYTDYKSLPEAFSAHGITTLVAPTWFPEGFKLIDLTVLTRSNSNDVYFMAKFEDSHNKSIIFSATKRNHAIIRNYEKDSNFVEEYNSGGITHYCYTNLDQCAVLWFSDNIECSIFADLPLDTLKTIISSIYGKVE